jgi:hypothetical protein
VNDQFALQITIPLFFVQKVTDFPDRNWQVKSWYFLLDQMPTMTDEMIRDICELYRMYWAQIFLSLQLPLLLPFHLPSQLFIRCSGIRNIRIASEWKPTDLTDIVRPIPLGAIKIGLKPACQ